MWPAFVAPFVAVGAGALLRQRPSRVYWVGGLGFTLLVSLVFVAVYVPAAPHNSTAVMTSVCIVVPMFVAFVVQRLGRTAPAVWLAVYSR